jgi:hypothetical protein
LFLHSPKLGFSRISLSCEVLLTEQDGMEREPEKSGGKASSDQGIWEIGTSIHSFPQDRAGSMVVGSELQTGRCNGERHLRDPWNRRAQ